VNALVAFVSGLLFAAGLVVGGMTQPEKIVDFLDFFGDWDPSLALVMGGALLVNIVAYQWTTSRDTPFVGHEFYIPTRNDLDWQLITGSILFGIGWGVSGYCPGPAITASGSASTPALVTLGGIVVGVFSYRGFNRLLERASSGDDG
jgi:uncharacterized membrane protein YedE/YeeE